MKTTTLIFLTALAGSATTALGKDMIPSAEHREDLDYQWYVNPIALTDLGAAFGAGIGVRVDQDLWLEALAMKVPGAESATTGTTTEADFEIIRLKNFVGNSFYVEVGVGQRHIDQQVRPYDAYEYNDGYYSPQKKGPSYNLHTQSLGLTGGIGNQWQWRHFTIGAEWVGAFIPVMTQAASSTDPTYSKDAKALASRPSALTVAFLLGFSF